MQLVSPVRTAPHAVWHAVAPQMYGVHVLMTEPVQLPVPLQLPCVVWLPLEHEAPTQIVLLPYFSHTPPAAHLPSVPQPVEGCTAQEPRGSVVPAVTLVHVPLVPPVSAFEHAWQVPLHAVLQQKPFAQLPLTHWVVAPGMVQALPVVNRGTHWCPALQ